MIQICLKLTLGTGVAAATGYGATIFGVTRYMSIYGMANAGLSVGLGSAGASLTFTSGNIALGVSQSKNGIPLKLMKTPNSKNQKYVGPTSFQELFQSIKSWFD